MAAFNKSIELRQVGDAFNWFFLAMAHSKLDDRGQARKRYNQAVQWVERNRLELAKGRQERKKTSAWKLSSN